MKIDTQILEDHQAKLVVEVDPAQLEAAKQRAARKIAQKTKISGFRPGKAPYPVILRSVGEAAVIEEAVELLVDEIYPKVITESGIHPFGPGRLENIPSMDPLTFEFIVPLDAEVTLGDYKAIRIPYELEPVKEEEVDRVIDNLRERNVILEPANRPAQVGDEVYLHIDGKRTQPTEGEKPELLSNQQHTIVIPSTGDNADEQWPFPGFSNHLVGMSAGEEKTVTVTFPEDSDYESLRGVEAEFRFHLDEVKARTLPELDDEFAQSINEEYNSIQMLRDEIRKMLEQQAKEAYDDEYTNKIITQMAEEAQIKYPPQLLEQEIDNHIEQLKDRLASQKMELETYLKLQQKDLEAFRQEVKPLAENRIRRSLVLYEAARAEKIEVTPDEVQAESARTLGQMSQYYEPKQVQKMMNKEFVQNMVSSVSSEMIARRTRERLQAIARGEAPVEEPSAEAPAPEKPKKPRAAKKTKKTETTEQSTSVESESLEVSQ
ncbi:MAG: trigger factor [Anaerolineales bacterium]|nr:trigger factor [Anaerolineales bacterium]